MPKLALLVLVVLGCMLTSAATAQTRFRILDQGIIESRLKSFTNKNSEREVGLKHLFAESGCDGNNLSEQLVKSKLPPNVICVLPGNTDEVILVGAHSDKVNPGDGVADNWSGASLLPSLLYGLSGQARNHTFVFVAFTAEERGLIGSHFYVHQLSPEQRSKVEGMINLDTLGLSPTKVWATRADTKLLAALFDISRALELPVDIVNVDNGASTDSESFAAFHIPRITIHSVTQETWPVLHSSKDKLDAIKLDDYYATYHLLLGYLELLDRYLGSPASPAQNRH